MAYFRLCYVNAIYTDFLRNHDRSVPTEHDHFQRPYLAIEDDITKVSVLIPLSSKYYPTESGNYEIKRDGRYTHEFLGSLRLNFMIPLRKEFCSMIDFQLIVDEQYRKLISKQWSVIRDRDFQKELLLYTRTMINSQLVEDLVITPGCNYRKLLSVYQGI